MEWVLMEVFISGFEFSGWTRLIGGGLLIGILHYVFV